MILISNQSKLTTEFDQFDDGYEINLIDIRMLIYSKMATKGLATGDFIRDSCLLSSREHR